MSRMPKIMIIALLAVSLVLSFGAGCVLDTRNPSGTSQGLEMVEEAWNIIFQDYVDKDKLDASKMSQAAIKGMIEAVDDPYTSYLDPETYAVNDYRSYS